MGSVLSVDKKNRTDAMPLYLYECHTCELEMEELYPIGQAPDRSIRCPLCGGWFERVMAPVHSGGRSAHSSVSSWVDPQLRHASECICCRPRSAKERK